jgi:hypothetical protein
MCGEQAACGMRDGDRQRPDRSLQRGQKRQNPPWVSSLSIPEQVWIEHEELAGATGESPAQVVLKLACGRYPTMGRRSARFLFELPRELD